MPSTILPVLIPKLCWAKEIMSSWGIGHTSRFVIEQMFNGHFGAADPTASIPENGEARRHRWNWMHQKRDDLGPPVFEEVSKMPPALMKAFGVGNFTRSAWSILSKGQKELRGWDFCKARVKIMIHWARKCPGARSPPWQLTPVLGWVHPIRGVSADCKKSPIAAPSVVKIESDTLIGGWCLCVWFSAFFLDKMPSWDVFCLLCLQKLWAQQACVDEGIISVWRSGAHAVHSQDVVLSSDLGLCFRSNLQCNEASSAYGPLPLCPCGAGWSTSAGCRAVPRSTRS